MKRMFVIAMLVVTAAAYADEIPYAGCFDVASRRHGVDLGLLLGVASVESNWNADARSHRGAHGIMQIRWPLTARHLGAVRVAELYNPCFNIDLGARYLRELLDTYDDDPRLALAAYNYGPTRIRHYGDVPATVRRYVDRVRAHQAQIERRFASREAPEGGFVELARFDRPSRAGAFAASLRGKVPDAEFSVAVQQRQGVVLVNAATLTPAGRYRLSSLLPEFFQE